MYRIALEKMILSESGRIVNVSKDIKSGKYIML